MTVKITINGVEYAVCNNLTIDERLDEQLDGGGAQVRTKNAEKFPDFSEAIVSLTDGETTKTIPFFCFDTVEKRAAGYYVHTLELIEPSRWLMGLTVDGLRLTQPIDGEKKTLHEALERLLRCHQTLAVGESPYFTIDEGIKPLLEGVESPEFEWQPQTLLWEALCDIGSVVDCIPRLTTAAGGRLSLITFDKVNDVTGEYEL